MAPIVLTFVAVFLLIVSGGLLLLHRDALMQRLASVVSPRADEDESWVRRLTGIRSTASLARAVDPFQKLLPRSPEEVSVAQRRLILAGYRKDVHVDIFYGAKVLVPLSLVVLATVTGAYEYGPFFVYALAAGLGFLLPDYWLGNRISARQFKIKLALPEALDLMVICIEAGLGLDQAILRASDELRLSQPELTDEFESVESRAARRKTARRRLEEPGRADRHRKRARPGIDAHAGRPFRHQYRQVSTHPLRSSSHTAAPGSRGAGREDDGEAGISAGVVYFSRPCSLWCWAPR